VWKKKIRKKKRRLARRKKSRVNAVGSTPQLMRKREVTRSERTLRRRTLYRIPGEKKGWLGKKT